MKLPLFILLIVSLVCCGGAKDPTPPTTSSSSDPCKDVELEVEKVWSATIKAEVLQYKGGGSVEERQKIANKMDAISEDWVRLRRSVCLDHFQRKIITADEYKKQVRCFDDRLDQQRKLVSVMKSDGKDEEAKAIVAKLGETTDACK